MRIAYASTARLPSTMANGIQTVRMCEGIASTGASVVLYHFRAQDRQLATIPVGSYYGTNHSIAARCFRRELRWLPKRFIGGRSGVLRGINALVWSMVASREIVRDAPDLCVTREPLLAWCLIGAGCDTALELHDAPDHFERALIRRVTATRRSRAVVAVTSGLADDIAHGCGIPRSAVGVLHDGVDVGRYEDAPSRDDARRQIGLDPERRLAVYTGQLYRQKGVETVVEASARIPDVDVALVGGSDSDRVRMRVAATRANAVNVRFVPYLQPRAVIAYQAAADVLLLPNSARHIHSARYSSPLKLFEYMAAQRPIVASDVPAVREVLAHGENAWLVMPDDPEALADGIVTMLENPSLGRLLSDSAWRDVGRYSWGQRARELVRMSR